MKSAVEILEKAKLKICFKKKERMQLNFYMHKIKIESELLMSM